MDLCSVSPTLSLCQFHGNMRFVTTIDDFIHVSIYANAKLLVLVIVVQLIHIWQHFHFILVRHARSKALDAHCRHAFAFIILCLLLLLMIVIIARMKEEGLLRGDGECVVILIINILICVLLVFIFFKICCLLLMVSVLIFFHLCFLFVS